MSLFGSGAVTISQLAADATLRDDVLEPLLIALGATVTTPVRVLAVVPPDTVRGLFGTLADNNGDPLTIVDRAAIETFFADCVERTRPPAPMPITSAIVPPPPTAPVGVNIRHNLVASQVDDRTATPLGDTDHLAAISAYESIYGVQLEPSEDVMPSADQLAVLKASWIRNPIHMRISQSSGRTLRGCSAR